jgi:hypothetical protein
MNPGEVTIIEAKFDVPGKYVWHCHILEHEEHDMMHYFEVIAAMPAGMTAASVATPTGTDSKPLATATAVQTASATAPAPSAGDTIPVPADMPLDPGPTLVDPTNGLTPALIDPTLRKKLFGF